MENFLGQLAEILEVDEVKATDELEGFEAWDSLTILSIIALGSEEYSVELTNNEIKGAATVQGLYDLIQNK